MEQSALSQTHFFAHLTPPPPPQVYSKRQGSGGGSPKGINFLAWGPVTQHPGSRRPAYTLAFTIFDRVHVAALEYDFRAMRYLATVVPSQLPPTGFQRSYTCGTIDASGRMLVAGTTAGEAVVYALVAAPASTGPVAAAPTPFFKTALVVVGNGVHALLLTKANAGGGRSALFVGGGDGTLRCFMGRDADWVCTAEARVPARVVSLSMAASGSWLLVGTATGHIYRVAWAAAGAGAAAAPTPIPLTLGAIAPRGVMLSAFADLIEAGHTGAITAAAFHPRTSTALVTAGADASIRLWDLNDYRSAWAMHAAAAGPHATAVWAAECGCGSGFNMRSGEANTGAGAAAVAAAATQGLPCDTFVGLSDGSLRAFFIRAGGVESGAGPGGRAPSEAWRVTAHRSGVTCVTGNRAVVLTGGGDGRVCVWSRESHALLLSFSDHTRGVVGVLVDNASPEIVYSAGADRIIATYNLRAERRVRTHALPASDSSACTFTALAQLPIAPGSERELLAATSDGRIFLFDPDVPDVHAGAVDVLALLSNFRAENAGGADKDSIALPALKPGQARPELRITTIAAAPSARFVALGTACGRLVVLSLSAIGAAPPGSFRGPVNAGTFVATSGHVRAALVSQASVMKVLAVFNGRAAYTTVAWAPDERQIIATSDDACLAVFNWFA